VRGKRGARRRISLFFSLLRFTLLYLTDFAYSLSILRFSFFFKAKPVIKGRKFAANSWLHLYDFAKPNLWGCTGTFDDL
jgi:hypothetical protein